MDLSKLSINNVRKELWTCNILSEQRCLRKACEWTDELLAALPEEGEEKLLSKLEDDLNDVSNNFNPYYEHAKACFEMHEYDRAAQIVRNHMDDDKSRFLHYFSMYKAAEKKRIDLMQECSVVIHKKAILKFNELRDSLERFMDEHEPDGWLLYVYGLVLHKFRLRKNAANIIEKALNKTPINWSAWYILTQLVESKEQLYSLNLPNHLFKIFFYHTMRLDLDLTDKDPWIMVGCKEAKNCIDKYFKNSLYIKTLNAKALSYQPNQAEESIWLFSQIRTEDPYRVDAMDLYSNLLYNEKLSEELAKLAYKVEKVDSFTPEASSCIANSYSARGEHTKALLYLTRALRLNPEHSNSWTWVGYEYLGLKCIDKCIQAYRFAMSINHLASNRRALLKKIIEIKEMS